MNKISIIIPVLNEANYIGPLLRHLQENSSAQNIADIIVVDGGSTDGSQEIVQQINEVNFSGINQTPTNLILLQSARGRAKQMNRGAIQATGDILYFLHADSFPPKHFDQYIIDEVEKDHLAGCFRLQFDSDHWWLRLASWLTQFKWRGCRGGDQSQFITKTLFEDIGGFDERFMIYEDNMLINELYARRQFVVINKKLRTSARLYKKVGVWRLQFHFWSIYVRKWFGASADELHYYYQKHIANA